VKSSEPLSGRPAAVTAERKDIKTYLAEVNVDDVKVIEAAVDDAGGGAPHVLCRASYNSGVRILSFLLVLFAACDARADWLLGALTGAAHTNTNTITVSAPSTTIDDVEYRGEAWKSPIYYGLRGGWIGKGAWGVDGEWVHAKARSTTGSPVLTHFDQSHGLNFVLVSAVYRRPIAKGRATLLARGGGGFTLPHVEGTILGTHTESYQYGGLAWHGGVGTEIRIAGGLLALVDARLTRTAEELDVAGATVKGTFVTSHVDFGIGWRFGR
jgi:hypothetical protein